MENELHKTTILSGHENHGVNLCHRCGWPFPNPHPSARHRRAHKKVCGTIEGYKITGSETEPDVHQLHSDDEDHLSDDDQKTPSPIKKKNDVKEVGNSSGIGSSKSEEDFFSDAVTEFSDSGFSPGMEDRLESVKSVGKNLKEVAQGDGVGSHLLKAYVAPNTTGASTNLTESGQISNPDPLESKVDLSESTKPLHEDKAEEISCGLDRVLDVQAGSFPVKSEITPDANLDCGSEKLKIFSGQNTGVYFKGDADIDIVYNVIDDSDKSMCEAIQQDPKSEELSGLSSDSASPDTLVNANVIEIPDNTTLKSELLHVADENVSAPEILDTRVEEAADARNSDHVSTEMEKGEQPVKFEPIEQVFAPASGQVAADLSQHGDYTRAELADVCNLKDEETETQNIQLVAKCLPVVDDPVLIEDFKDFNKLKSNFPLDIGSDEVMEIAEHDAEVNVSNECHSISDLGAAGGRQDTLSRDIIAVKDDVDKESGEKTLEGEAYGLGVTSEEHYGSRGLQVLPHGTETISGAIGTDTEINDGGCNVTSHENLELSTLQEEETLLDVPNRKCANIEDNGIDLGNRITNPVNFNAQTSQEQGDKLVNKHDGISTVEVSLGPSCENESLESTMILVSGKSGESICASALDMNGSENIKDDSEGPIDEIVSKGISDPDLECRNLETTFQREETSHGAVVTSELSEDRKVIISERNLEKFTLEVSEPVESEISNRTTSEDKPIGHGTTSSTCVSAVTLQDESNKEHVAEHDTAPAPDISIASSSRTDSMEGNWGSVSVLSTQSDATAEALQSTNCQVSGQLVSNLKKPETIKESHPDKSEVFEHPSFMTLVESGGESYKNTGSSEIETLQGTQQPKSEALRSGWFPTLQNVVNESEGRKKNEEIIAKVTNWSTGKQHAPLKNLLGEASAEAKQKLPNSKQEPAVSLTDNGSPKDNGSSVTTVISVMGSEAPNNQATGGKVQKEWNSPAKYPAEIKKEKKKGKPYWVPFVCCTSVPRDI